MATEEKKAVDTKLNVKTGTYVGSTYSQVVGVTVTDTDVTLEFVYVNPRSKEGEVVSRITMPMLAGEGLAKAINDTIAQHIKNKGAN
jgi:hypothetical protein